jgi:protein-disulfide isomerase
MATSRSQTSRSRREELERQRLEKAKKDRQIRLISFGGGLVIIVAVVAVAIWGLNAASRGGDVLPLHADADQTGITLNATVAEGVPTLDIYTDFQCPYCASYEANLADTFAEIIADGTAKVTFHSLAMLDYMNANAGSPNLKSSTRSAVAAACADTLEGDYYLTVMNSIFENQPATEGDGFTDSTLRDLVPVAVGITGDNLTAYQTCYDDSQTGQFVSKVYDAAVEKFGSNLTTPTYLLNGVTINSLVTDWTADTAGDELKALIADATTS